jgi:hypothetical protein
MAASFWVAVHEELLSRMGTPVLAMRDKRGAAGWRSDRTVFGISGGLPCVATNADQDDDNDRADAALFINLPNRSEEGAGGVHLGCLVGRDSWDGNMTSLTGIERLLACAGKSDRMMLFGVTAEPLWNRSRRGFGGLGGKRRSLCRGPMTHKCASTKVWNVVVSVASSLR